MFVLVILASSTAIAIASATITAPNTLQTPGTLTIAGSSTVAPIAQEELALFPNYWNTLVAVNPAWGTTSALDVSQVSLAGLGSGTAIPALVAASGGADIGEMSRPPTSGSGSEYVTAGLTNLQLFAVGIDSVAIVVSPDMTWFPTDLTTLQVAQLFACTTPTNNNPDNGTALIQLCTRLGMTSLQLMVYQPQASQQQPYPKQFNAQ